MNITTVFIQRYDPLYKFYFDGFWSLVSHDLMRQRPTPRLNSIAWNLWHITRCEDAGLNYFVTDGSQVLDNGQWMEKLNIPWRHSGTEMTSQEVDELNQKIDLSALQAYSKAVQERTRIIVDSLKDSDLDVVMQETRLRKILIEEGLSHSNAEGFVKNYLGWSKGKCLMTFALTHSFQHLGEMEVLASLLGVDFG